MEDIYNIILEKCHNGTHSCKIDDLLIATNTTKQELWEALLKAPFAWRIGININKRKLLVLT